MLLVAGDLFSELAGPEGCANAIRHLQEVFERLPARRRHHPDADRQPRQGKLLPDAAPRHEPGRPAGDEPGAFLSPGRLYLADGADPAARAPTRASGGHVQFILMPYPTPARYLDDEAAQTLPGPRREESPSDHGLHAKTLHEVRRQRAPSTPIADRLSRHIAVQRQRDARRCFASAEQEDVVFAETTCPTASPTSPWATFTSRSSSAAATTSAIAAASKRLDLGEGARQTRASLLSTSAPEGLAGEPRVLPLEATPIYEVDRPHTANEITPTLARTLTRTSARTWCGSNVTYTAGRRQPRGDAAASWKHLPALVRP